MMRKERHATRQAQIDLEEGGEAANHLLQTKGGNGISLNNQSMDLQYGESNQISSSLKVEITESYRFTKKATLNDKISALFVNEQFRNFIMDQVNAENTASY